MFNLFYRFSERLLFEIIMRLPADKATSLLLEMEAAHKTELLFDITCRLPESKRKELMDEMDKTKGDKI